MSTFLKLNGNTAVPLDTIKFVRPLTQEDRARIAEKHGADVADRNIQVTFTDNTQKTYADTLDGVKEQGVGLVNVGGDKHVPAANIKTATIFTKADAEALAAKGYTLNGTFRSKIEVAGNTSVLSSAHTSQVMERRAKALGLGD